MKLLCSHRAEKQSWHRGARENGFQGESHDIEERIISFSVSLIACEGFHVFFVSRQDELTLSHCREKEMAGSALILMSGDMDKLILSLSTD